MLKGHPKGLVVAFFANMGERFGFYTMMGILVFFLQAKYGLGGSNAGLIYSIFYFSIYALSLFGGIIADYLTRKGKKGLGQTIFAGIVIMFAGYVLMAIPLGDRGTFGLVVTLISLFVIAFGNGLFKGNLQAMVGNLYEDKKYSHLRDRAFSIFYMGINVGAFFAPNAASAIRTWYLGTKGFAYDPELPQMCNSFMAGETVDIERFTQIASTASGKAVTDLGAFADSYIAAFSTGYHYAFGLAGVAMLISLAVYVIFKGHLKAGDLVIGKDGDNEAADGATVVEDMSPEQTKQRFIAMGLVMVVVMFFWMAFHQNGLTLSFFARDYVVKSVDPGTYMLFDLKAILSVIGAIIGLVLLLGKKNSMKYKGLGALLMLVFGYLSYYFYTGYDAMNVIEPEIFLQFNAIFIVFLTPVVVAFFAFLDRKKLEPSTPRKIGIGMILAGLGFLIMIVGSLGLVAPKELATAGDYMRVSPYWLINLYLVHTIAELFLSPMGISFFSKIAPPKSKGLAQGLWLGATAAGNLFLFVGSEFWVRMEVWQVWALFLVCCGLSAGFIFAIMKRLEAAANS